MDNFARHPALNSLSQGFPLAISPIAKSHPNPPFAGEKQLPIAVPRSHGNGYKTILLSSKPAKADAAWRPS
ncbi:MAG: hypothetical protein ACTTJV_04245 [Ottowia sp.]